MSQQRIDRQQLRAALRQRYPWLDRLDVGAQAVEAGECDRCGTEARLAETCGPVAWQYLGRRCAAELGSDAWCDGHAEEAASALAWLAQLPDEADTVARLWWVATGEVTLDPNIVTERAHALGLALPPPAR